MPVTSKESWRWELILDGAVRVYPGGRQVCTDTLRGKAEYKWRTEVMRLRQHNICGRGAHLIIVPTFDHFPVPRGAGGGFRDDRIVDENGDAKNCCSCWNCNTNAGSRRV